MKKKKQKRKRMVRIMKIIKNLFLTIASIIHGIYIIIDKVIIIPVTKFFIAIRDKFSNRTDRLEKWLTRNPIRR